MGDKQKRWPGPAGGIRELLVVERGHYGLSSARRGDDQVAMSIMTFALEPERVQHALLVWIGAHIEVREGDGRALAQRPTIVLAQRSPQLLTVHGRVVQLEVR